MLHIGLLSIDDACVSRGIVAACASGAIGATVALVLRKRERSGPRWLQRSPAVLAALALANFGVALAWSNVLKEAASVVLRAPIDRAFELVAVQSLVVAFVCAVAVVVTKPWLRALGVSIFAGLLATLPVHRYGFALHDAIMVSVTLDRDADLVHVGTVVTLRAACVDDLPSSRVLGFQIGGGRVKSDPQKRGWAVVPHVLTVDHPGTIDAEVEVERPYLRLTSPVTLFAGEDRGDGLLALAKGRAWRYRVSDVYGASGLVVSSRESASNIGTLDLSIVGDKTENDLHLWSMRLVRTDSMGAVLGDETFEVYGFDGTTRMKQNKFASKADPPLASGCDVAIFPSFDCTCDDHGPKSCRRSDTSKPNLVVNALLTMFTAGLVPIADHSTRLERESYAP